VWTPLPGPNIQMKTVLSSETLVSVYQCTPCHKPKECNYQHHRCDNLKSHVQSLAETAPRAGWSVPIPVVERSKGKDCGRSLAGVAGSNPAGGIDVCVVSKDKRRNAAQSRQRHKYRLSTHRVQENTRKKPGGGRGAQGPTQPPIQRVPGLFAGGKAAAAWR
jgi:hypothetical protein